jgi:hypothetical protein
MDKIVIQVFLMFLFITMMLSFYIFINVLNNNKKYKSVFSAWQFPMLFAIFLECFFSENIK